MYEDYLLVYILGIYVYFSLTYSSNYMEEFENYIFIARSRLTSSYYVTLLKFFLINTEKIEVEKKEARRKNIFI